MGILDDAIRDHLDLKRRSGAAQSDLKRLEDEAFGPPSRPGDPPSQPSPTLTVDPDAGPDGIDDAPRASAPVETAVAEPSTVLEPPPPAPQEEPVQADAVAEPPSEPADGDQIADNAVFHDFAAEEGLVSGGPASGAPASEPTSQEQTAEQTPEPAPQPPTGDTQPHDMAAELHTPEDNVLSEPEEVDLDAELGTEIELELDEDEELRPESVRPEPPPPPSEPVRAGVIEEEEEEEELEEEELLDDDEVEVIEEDEEIDEDLGDDVLEETPDFLQETPEHDRLWFEQRPPKDFDFEE